VVWEGEKAKTREWLVDGYKGRRDASGIESRISVSQPRLVSRSVVRTKKQGVHEN